MSPIRKSMRFAHSDGHTSLCFERSGRYLLTCGSDGDVRIWDGLEDGNPKSIDVGDITYAVAIHASRIFASSEENSILSYTFPNTVRDGLIARFSAPVSHMCLSETGNELLAGSCDFSIKYIQLTDNSFKVLLGHEAPILSVALDNKLQYGASSSCDGTVRVWNLDKQTCIKSWVSVCPTSNDFSTAKVLCKLCWQPPSGNFLAVPFGKNVKFFKRDTWEESFVLEDETINVDINIISFSKCGYYLAAACLNGDILIWNMDTRKRVERLNHEKGITICSLEWNPNGNGDIAFCDIQGKLGGFENVLQPKPLPSPSPLRNLELPLLQEEDDGDDDNENSFSISKIKAETVGLDSFLDDDLNDDEIKTKLLTTNDSEKLKTPAIANESLCLLPKLYDPQRPFQPGSTPANYQHRFMMWNSVGIIRSYNTEEENSIDIEFHDIAVHHSMHLENFLNHTIAGLSSTAVILACQAQLEVPSKLVCLHFGSWDSCKEWTIDMPESENIEALSLSQDWVVAVTSHRQVRIFTIGSVQRYILALPGPVVAVAGFMDQFVVCYHHALGISGDQCLSMMSIDLRNGRATVQQHSLPLSPKSTLSWIGYTDEGTPCSVDSSGVVRLLSNALGGGWIQIADTKKHVKGKSDHYFIVGLSESQQQIRCILCKGSRYPQTLPHPTVTILSFQIPVCEISCEKGQLEETYMRQSLLLGTLAYLEELGFDTDNTNIQQTKTRQKETLMKLFALACRSDREFRALELSHMMDSYHTVQLAIKYASQLRHLGLAQKLGEVAYQKMESELNPQVPQSELVCSKTTSAARHSGKICSEREIERESSDEEGVEDDDDDSSKPVAEKSEVTSSRGGIGGRHNPFKVSLVPPSSKGIQALDEMTTTSSKKKCSQARETRENVEKATPVSKKRQGQLFAKQLSKKDVNQDTVEMCESPNAPSKEPKSGFQLWLESNQELLKLDNPHSEQHDTSLAAVKVFKNLPVEEKQMWNEKATTLNSSSPPPSLSATPLMSKRKLDEESRSATKKLRNLDKLEKCGIQKRKCSQTDVQQSHSVKSKLKQFMFK